MRYRRWPRGGRQALASRFSSRSMSGKESGDPAAQVVLRPARYIAEYGSHFLHDRIPVWKKLAASTVAVCRRWHRPSSIINHRTYAIDAFSFSGICSASSAIRRRRMDFAGREYSCRTLQAGAQRNGFQIILVSRQLADMLDHPPRLRRRKSRRGAKAPLLSVPPSLAAQSA